MGNAITKRRCKTCNFKEVRTSISEDYSEGMKVDLCGKMRDQGSSRKDSVIVLMDKCPLEG